MSFSIFGILAVILEVIRPALPWLLTILVLWLIALGMLFAKRKQQPLCSNWRALLLIGAVVGVLGLLFVPMITGASHSNLHSVIDYLALVGASFGLGVSAAVLAWPLLGLLQANR